MGPFVGPTGPCTARPRIIPHGPFQEVRYDTSELLESDLI